MIGMIYVRLLQMTNSYKKERLEFCNTELQEKIVDLLKDNNGRMEESALCDQLNISRHEIPWGYNMGWARLHQVGGYFDLVLSGSSPT